MKLVAVEKKDFRYALVMGEKIPKPYRYQIIGIDGFIINAYPLYRLTYNHIMDMLNFLSIEKTRSYLIWYFNELKNSEWITEQSKKFPIILNKKFTSNGYNILKTKQVLYLRKKLDLNLSIDFYK